MFRYLTVTYSINPNPTHIPVVEMCKKVNGIVVDEISLIKLKHLINQELARISKHKLKKLALLEKWHNQTPFYEIQNHATIHTHPITALYNDDDNELPLNFFSK